MIRLDELADDYRAGLDVPAGPGPDAVMRDGRRRRRRRRTALAIAVVGVVLAGFAGVLAVAIDGDDVRDQAPVLDSVPTSSPSIEVSIDTERLPRRSGESMPLVPIPSAAGWSLEATSVNVTDRFGNAGTSATYRLGRGDDEVIVAVLPGQHEIWRPLVTIDRPGGPVEASEVRGGDGERSIKWNERPGVNSGTAVTVSGSDRELVLDVAERVVFEELPLVGASAPSLRTSDPTWSPLMMGHTDGVHWSVNRVDDETIVAIDGRSPIGSTTIGTSHSLPLEMITVSRDGLQVTAIDVPVDVSGVYLATPAGDRIELPRRPIDDGDRQIAVAAVPSDRDATAVAVVTADGTEELFGLPPAPPQGWTTSRMTTFS